MMHSKKHIVHFSLFVVYLLATMLCFISSKKELISDIEKRPLAKLPSISVSSIFDGSLAKNYEAYVDDHFPMREELINLAYEIDTYKGIHDHKNAKIIIPFKKRDVKKNRTKKQIKNDEAANVLDEKYLVNAESTMSKGLLVIGGSCYQIFGGEKRSAAFYAKMLDKYREILPSKVRLFNCVVPTAGSFTHTIDYDYLRKNEYTNIKQIYNFTTSSIININAAEEILKHHNEYIYFNTDHHWTGLGAYYAYVAFCAKAEILPIQLKQMKRKVKHHFLGSLYALTRDPIVKNNPDSVVYFVPPVKTEFIEYAGINQGSKIKGELLARYATGVNSYGVFLGGDHAMVHIKTSLKNGKRILVVKNSFGNPFATYLVNNYEEVIVIDYRYFRRGLLSVVNEFKINDVLFLHNVFSANTDSHTKRQTLISDPIQSEKTSEKTSVKIKSDPAKQDSLFQINPIVSPIDSL